MEVKKGLCMLAMIVITTLIVFLLVLIITNKPAEQYDDAKSKYCRFTDTCKGTKCKPCDEFDYSIQNKCPREIGASMGVDGTLSWSCVRNKECYSNSIDRSFSPRTGSLPTCAQPGQDIYDWTKFDHTPVGCCDHQKAKVNSLSWAMICPDKPKINQNNKSSMESIIYMSLVKVI